MITQQAPATYQDHDLTQTVHAAQRSDRQAFGELAARYQRAVYATVYRRLGNHAESQEMCQEVLIQAMQKIDQLRDPRCFGGWLRSIANRMAINRLIRRTPTVTVQQDAIDASCVDGCTPLGKLLVRERKDQVHVGLDRLRALDRDTLVSFYFDGNTLLEMSRQFGSPVGTIKRRLHVARKRLAKELEAMAGV